VPSWRPSSSPAFSSWPSWWGSGARAVWSPSWRASWPTSGWASQQLKGEQQIRAIEEDPRRLKLFRIHSVITSALGVFILVWRRFKKIRVV
jgi:hypothetical protein